MRIGRPNPSNNASRRRRTAMFGRSILGSGIGLGMTGFSIGWLDRSNWRLPSGQALAEFALRAGFLAPVLLKTEQLRSGQDAAEVEAAAGRVIGDSVPRTSAKTHGGAARPVPPGDER